MARKERYITRTLKETYVSYKYYDTEEDTLDTGSIFLAGDYDNDTDIIEDIEADYKNQKVVKILDKEVSESLYKMTETMFRNFGTIVEK